MKKMKFILNGFMALAFGVMFAQCAGNNNANTASAPAAEANGSSNMKIAFVEIDSLLSKYHLCNDVNEQMIKKEENIRTTLNEKGKKLENNGFVSPERAQQEYQRIQKQQQDLQALQQKLLGELEAENQKNSLELRDSINSFLRMYNETKGYDLIISNTAFDNLLYGNPAYNITDEIVEGLNARYNPSVKK